MLLSVVDCTCSLAGTLGDKNRFQAFNARDLAFKRYLPSAM